MPQVVRVSPFKITQNTGDRIIGIAVNIHFSKPLDFLQHCMLFYRLGLMFHRFHTPMFLLTAVRSDERVFLSLSSSLAGFCVRVGRAYGDRLRDHVSSRYNARPKAAARESAKRKISPLKSEMTNQNLCAPTLGHVQAGFGQFWQAGWNYL
eukprot:1480095-Rhodomonas_salina.1